MVEHRRRDVGQSDEFVIAADVVPSVDEEGNVEFDVVQMCLSEVAAFEEVLAVVRRKHGRDVTPPIRRSLDQPTHVVIRVSNFGVVKIQLCL